MSNSPTLPGRENDAPLSPISHGVGLDLALPAPLALIEFALRDTAFARKLFPDFRLSRLVASRLDMDEDELYALAAILDAELLLPLPNVGRPFDSHLREVIARFRLEPLFNVNGAGRNHHAVQPNGYDFVGDEVIPGAMEQWRADYREMSDERQMMAATILWLYRAGTDKTWLRRVPMNWQAIDAICVLKSKGALTDWGRLIALYPGW